jgi:hypothetical protein
MWQSCASAIFAIIYMWQSCASAICKWDAAKLHISHFANVYTQQRCTSVIYAIIYTRQSCAFAILTIVYTNIQLLRICCLQYKLNGELIYNKFRRAAY